jgi:hypothetical protein
VETLTYSVIYDDETWLMDNGASMHMNGFKDFVSNLRNILLIR